MNKINTILNFQEEKQMKCLRSKEKKGKFTIKKLKRQVKGITLIALVVTKMMVVDLLQASFG